MKNSNVKFLALLATLFITLSGTSFAAEKVDYYQLAKTGTLKEIKSAVNLNPGLCNQKFGDSKNTFLMLVLNCNREPEIVEFLLKKGCSVTDSTTNKITPLMYAAQYSTYPEVIDKVLSFGASSKSAKKKRILQTDEYGKSSLDYAKLNHNLDVYSMFIEITGEVAQETNDRNRTINIVYGEEATGSSTSGSSKTDTRVVEIGGSTSSSTSKDSKSKTKGSGTATATYVPDTPVADTSTSKDSKTNTKGTGTATATYVPDTPAADTGKTSGTSSSSAGKTSTASTNTSTSTPASTSTEEPSKTAQADTSKTEGSKSTTPAAETKTETSSTTAPSETKTESSATPTSAGDDSEGVTLLMLAAKAGNDWDVQNLLSKGADVNATDSDGWTALMYAVRYQNSLSVVKTLIDAGASTTVKNSYGATPLLVAADYSQNIEIIKLLIGSNTKSNSETCCAFILALTSPAGSAHIRKAKVDLFLDMGISVNTIWKGKTPLMYAAEYCTDTQIIQYLLDRGAVKDLSDESGKTAFDYAKANTSLPHDASYNALKVGK